jgi:cytochrome c oxidase subunit 2
VMRYPGPDGRLNSSDDLITVNDLHFVKNKQALIYLKSSDVLHSFYLPHLRIKQDAVPGITIPVWFDSDTAGHFELVCAELCGWGHYKMRGKVTIHETEAEFQQWVDDQLAEQNRSQVTATTNVAGQPRIGEASAHGEGGAPSEPHRQTRREALPHAIVQSDIQGR